VGPQLCPALLVDYQLNRRRRFARVLPTFGRVDDLTYWQEKLRQAEADLDAAREHARPKVAAPDAGGR